MKREKPREKDWMRAISGPLWDGIPLVKPGRAFLIVLALIGALTLLGTFLDANGLLPEGILRGVK